MSRHNIKAPADVMIGQYSVPFCVALAVMGDAEDPRTFRDVDVTNAEIRALSDRVRLVPWSAGQRPSPLASTTTVKTNDGRVLKATVTDFKGTPDNPLSHEELRGKFLMLTRHCDQSALSELFERIQRIEDEPSLEWISV